MDEILKNDLGVMAAFAVVVGAFALAACWSWHSQAIGAIPPYCVNGNTDASCRASMEFPAGHPFVVTILVMLITAGLVRLAIFMQRMEQSHSR